MCHQGPSLRSPSPVGTSRHRGSWSVSGTRKVLGRRPDSGVTVGRCQVFQSLPAWVETPFVPFRLPMSKVVAGSEDGQGTDRGGGCRVGGRVDLDFGCGVHESGCRGRTNVHFRARSRTSRTPWPGRRGDRRVTRRGRHRRGGRDDVCEPREGGGPGRGGRGGPRGTPV